MSELYCVLHKSSPWPFEKTASFLAAELCVGGAGAEAAAAKNPGFLLENSSLSKASAFNLRASAYGLETVLLSHLDLKPPPEALPVSRIELKPAGFYYTCGPVREYVPFASVKALAAAAFYVDLPPADPGETLKDSLSSLIGSLRARYFPGVPFPDTDRKTEKERVPARAQRETVFTADILTSERRLSLSCEELDYSGLGSLKTLSGFDNFRILLSETAALAQGARRTAFLDAFIKKGPLGRLRHPSSEAYEKELLWLSTISGAESPERSG